MKKTALFTATAFLSASLLTGCAGGQSPSNQDVGAVTGGVVGGLLGSQFGGGSGQVAAAVAGTMFGAFVGSKIGQTMDQQDQMQMQQSLEKQRTGQESTWKNPDSGNEYDLKPTKTYSVKGQPCRDFTMIVNYPDGTTDVTKGKACRMSNGNWNTQ